MHLIGTGHLDKARPWPQSMFSAEKHAALQTTENRLFKEAENGPKTAG